MLNKPPRSVVFIVESPFSERDEARFGIRTLESAGFRVDVWDLTPVLHPAIAPLPATRARVLREREEALAALSGLEKEQLAVALFGFNRRSLPLHAALAASRAPFAVFHANSIPKDPPSPRERAVRAAKEALFSAAVVAGRLRPAELALTGGSAWAQRCVLPAASTTEVVRAHCLDYDLYLSLKDQPAPRLGGAVFLDEYVPFHPDYVHYGCAPYSTAERYYPAMRALFDRVEKELGLPVTIAAHPLSRYDEQPERFGGRPVIKGRTPELVRAASLVISHSSTAVNFAVLFAKPILFATTSDLDASPQRRLMAPMARAFGKAHVDAGRASVDWPAQMHVDPAAYGAYRRAFIKQDGSPERPFWTIVAERLACRAAAPAPL